MNPRYLLFFGALYLLFSSICWSAPANPTTPKAKSQQIIQQLYLDYVFAEEYRIALRALITSARNTWNEIDTGKSRYRDDIETKRYLLTKIIQQTIKDVFEKSFTSSSGTDGTPHLWDTLAQSPLLSPLPEAEQWHRDAPTALRGTIADDNTQPLDTQIEISVARVLNAFPQATPTQNHQEMAIHLASALMDIHETNLRGRALRFLAYRVHEQEDNPDHIPDPQFNGYPTHLTEAFEQNATLWQTQTYGIDIMLELATIFESEKSEQDHQRYRHLSRFEASLRASLFITGFISAAAVIPLFCERSGEQAREGEYTNNLECSFKIALKRLAVISGILSPVALYGIYQNFHPPLPSQYGKPQKRSCPKLERGQQRRVQA